MPNLDYKEKLMKLEKSEKGHMIVVSHITIRQSISFLVLRLIAIETIAAFAIIAFHTAVMSSFVKERIFEGVSFFNIPFFMILVVLKTFFMIFIMVQWLNQYYEISTKEVIYRKGLIFKKEERYEFEHIGSIELEQGIFGKLLNFGTIKLFDWATEKDVLLYLIHNPMKYEKILEDLIPEADRGKKVVREHIIEPDE